MLVTEWARTPVVGQLLMIGLTSRVADDSSPTLCFARASFLRALPYICVDAFDDRGEGTTQRAHVLIG